MRSDEKDTNESFVMPMSPGFILIQAMSDC
jgi:hypothetical protein